MLKARKPVLIALFALLLLLAGAGTQWAQVDELGAIHFDLPYDLSGAVFLATPEAAEILASLPPALPPQLVEGADQPLSSTSTSGPLFTTLVSNDSNQDVEAAIMSITLGSGVTRTTSAFIKYVTIGGQLRTRNYFRTTTDFSTWAGGELPIPTGYLRSADPLMDANIHTTGIAAKRMYTVGITLQQQPFQLPNAIALWRSDNGGATWTTPTMVTVNSTQSNYHLDKPDVAVSWYSNTLGHVYVAYVKASANININPHELYVARSTNGGLSFDAPILVTTGRIQGPQIMVDPATGRVYLVWVDYNLNAIRMSSATSAATSWTTPVSGATGNMVPPVTYLGGNVLGATIPMARWNGVANSLSIVWHQYEAGVSGATDIYYTAYSPSSGWIPKRLVNFYTERDQFMPSIDYDYSGELMIMFYDRYRDLLNSYYEESWAKIDPYGTLLAYGQLGTWSNPDKYGNKFVGDYQDIWFWSFLDSWGDRFNGVWTYQPHSGSGNINVTGIR
ncbi:MAG TPA: hypothetical protein VF121_16280 [Thermoanaerobaculia bacterium]|nr:hypothetical protein [Thermoanaerobaculia bacterium]